jgi:hypothetical protein
MKQMTDPPGDSIDKSEAAWEADEPESSGDDQFVDELDTMAEVECPHCGELLAIALDSGGGSKQDYVEDCQVCCRPSRIHLQYDHKGRAEVWAEETH